MQTLLLVCCLLQPDIEALLDKGYDLYSEEKYQEAISRFDEVLQLDETLAEAYLLRGLCRHSLGDTRKAVGDMEQAIVIDSTYVEAYQQLGYIYLVSQAPDRAIEVLDKAIALDPTNAQTYVNRGTAKCMKNDKSGAEEDWNRAKTLGIDYGEMMVCE